MKRALAAGLMLLVAVAATAQVRKMTPAESAQVEQQLRSAQQAEQAGRLDEAGAGFEAVLKLIPNSAEVHMHLGIVRHGQLRYTEAIPELQRSLELDPTLTAARAILGLDLFQIGDDSDAVVQLEKAVKEDPADPQFNGWLGMAYVATSQFRLAAPKLEFAVKAKPNSALFLGYLVRAYGGATDESQKQLDELSKGTPAGPLALGQAYAKTNNYDVAIDEYAAALAIDPKLPGVNGALGDIHSKLGHFPEAEQAYRKEIEIDPTSPLNQYHLGMILAELGRSEEALPYLANSVAGDPTNGEAFYYLGKVYFDQGRYAEAKETLNKALERPLHPMRVRAVHYQLWMTCRKLGDTAEAARQLEIFQKIDAEQAAQRKTNHR